LLKIPLEILTHSTPQKWCHVEGPALLLFYSRNSSFCLPNSDWWYRCRIWYSIIQRFIQIHLFSRQIYWNFQLQTFFWPHQMINSLFMKNISILTIIWWTTLASSQIRVSLVYWVMFLKLGATGVPPVNFGRPRLSASFQIFSRSNPANGQVYIFIQIIKTILHLYQW